jgi:hypothetical protein
MTDAAIFLYIGSISLILNTFKDMKTMKIDSVKNFVMSGFTLGFYFFTHVNVLISLDLTIIVFCLNWMMNKRGILFGEGDQEAFYWIVPGLFLVAWWAPILFAWSLFAFQALNFGIRWIKKVHDGVKTPAFIVVLGAFLLTAGTYFLLSI